MASPSARRAVPDLDGHPVGPVGPRSDRDLDADPVLGWEILFGRHPEPMWIYAVDSHRFLAVNEVAVRRYGWSEDEFLQMRVQDIRPQRDVVALERNLEEAAAGSGRQRSGTWRHLRADGSEMYVETTAQDVVFGGRAARLVVVHDVTQHRRMDHLLGRRLAQQAAMARLGHRALESRNPTAFAEDAVPEIAATLGVDACLAAFLDADGAGLRVASALGLPLEASRRLSLGEVQLLERALAQEDLPGMDAVVQTSTPQDALLVGAGIRTAAAVAMPGPGGPRGVLLVGMRSEREFAAHDATFLQTAATVFGQAIDRWAAEEQIRHRAFHDVLTGLPNRVLLFDRLEIALERSRRNGAPIAVLFCDLDGFKLINDSLGHAAGDELLGQVAPRIREALRPQDTIARFGGDEFVMVCEVDELQRGVDLAERLTAAFARPFVIGDTEHLVTASVGVAVGAGGACTADELIRDADSAMYRAKEGGRARFELWDEEKRREAIGRVRLESELRAAIDKGELELLYQPIVGLPSGVVQGFEALVRWNHPERGLLAPDLFIPLAEESGAIVPLGHWALRQACAQAATWTATVPGDPDPWVTVNLSMRQVGEPWLVATVAEALRLSGLQPARLGLEMTESVLLERDASIATLDELSALGVRLALDDFGTGWSSLAYVKRFPLDVLKIDRRFVAELGALPGDRSIVEAIVRMAQGLRLRVVAEGVETEEQRAELHELGCASAQGFLFSRPVHADQVPTLLCGPLPVGGCDSDGLLAGPADSPAPAGAHLRV